LNELRFFVSGEPVPKGRPRVVRTKSGKSHTFTDDKTAAWEQLVRWVARVEAHKRRWRPTADPCEVEIALRGLNPRSDVDNAAKAVLDALNGLAWDDDRRVWSLLVRRDETLAVDGALVIVRRAGGLEEGARA
jgi:crossover junction endodeoxyribonuclease RusA